MTLEDRTGGSIVTKLLKSLTQKIADFVVCRPERMDVN